MTQAQTWASYSALYQFGRLSRIGKVLFELLLQGANWLPVEKCGCADVPSGKVRRKNEDKICGCCGKMRIWHCGCTTNEWLSTFILLMMLTGHFGTKTVRHQYGMVPKCLETIRHQFFTGAELSGHVGTSAEIARDTSAPSVKNTLWAIVLSE